MTDNPILAEAAIELLAGAGVALLWSRSGVEQPPRRRRGGSIEYRRRHEKWAQPAPPDIVVGPNPLPAPERAPIVPGAPVPVRRKPVVARSLADLGTVLGLDSKALDAARRRAEQEDEDDVELLLVAGW